MYITCGSSSVTESSHDTCESTYLVIFQSEKDDADNSNNQYLKMYIICMVEWIRPVRPQYSDVLHEKRKINDVLFVCKIKWNVSFPSKML